jgi:putative tricarboxylic transport membrane protein
MPLANEVLQVFIRLASDPWPLGLSILGVIIGIIFGALPGISSTMSLAVLLPLTFGMDLTNAILFLMAVFNSSVYGGSIAAILINIPGTPGSIVTQMDGHPMAKKGRAGEAMTYAILASAFGGIFGWILLMFFAPLIALVALKFQSPEYAAVTFFGLTMLAYASPGSTFKAFVGGIFGLLLATVGLDGGTNISRFEFGIPAMQGGISIIPLAVGIFGLSEVLRGLEIGTQRFEAIRNITRLFPPWKELWSTWPAAVRGGLIGVIVGAIPAAGSAIGVVISYAQEKQLSKHPELFGTGIPEGIVSPESSNNACVGGALIPMMTLGIPGDSMTAVLIGGLLIHGLRPGPALFKDRLDFVALVYVGLLVAVILTTGIGLLGARAFAKVLDAPRSVLLAGVAVLCVVGSYAVNNSLFDVLVMVVFGVVGYLMPKVGMPVAPVGFGLILGPILEENIRRSLIVNGTWWVFLQRPISLAMLLVSVAALVYPMLRRGGTRGLLTGGQPPAGEP